MAESKYDYLKTTGIVRDSIYPPFLGMIFFAQKEEGFQIRFTHVSEPFEMKEEAHEHDFAEIFVFVPCNADLNAYDAESEIGVGEGDKLVINETTAVYIPAGLKHCPIIHKRVGTPFFFVNCPVTPEYSAIINGEKRDYPVPKEIFNPDKHKPMK